MTAIVPPALSTIQAPAAAPACKTSWLPCPNSASPAQKRALYPSCTASRLPGVNQHCFMSSRSMHGLLRARKRWRPSQTFAERLKLAPSTMYSFFTPAFLATYIKKRNSAGNYVVVVIKARTVLDEGLDRWYRRVQQQGRHEGFVPLDKRYSTATKRPCQVCVTMTETENHGGCPTFLSQ